MSNILCFVDAFVYDEWSMITFISLEDRPAVSSPGRKANEIAKRALLLGATRRN
jgi:hypothetical protein